VETINTQKVYRDTERHHTKKQQFFLSTTEYFIEYGGFNVVFIQFDAYTKGISCSSGCFLKYRSLVVKTCRCNFNSGTPDEG
jgi:hypothetical protein